MISTATMVRLGYVSGNRMSNLQARNIKLRDRAERIVVAETGLDQKAAAAALDAAGGDLRVALVMIKSGSTKEEATRALEGSGWVVDVAVEKL
jgi:N-acetylmuramic acid 6-phosphate etherase